VDIDHYRKRLLEIERTLVGRIDRSTATARETVDESAGDAGDESVSDEMKDERFTEADLDSVTLADVRDALRRIDDGTFGRCVVDGKPIEEKRLEAMPWTPYCLKHQQAREAGRRTSPTL
jgi:DnaK suppressor protein